MPGLHGGSWEADIDLSTNTNPRQPPWLAEAIMSCLDRGVLRRYPDQRYERLREAIAEYFRLSPETVIPTAGAAEAINLLITAARPGHVVTISPTYGEEDLRGLCSVIGCSVVNYVMSDEGRSFRIVRDDLVGLIRRLGPADTLVYATNPNNPTGEVVLDEQLVGELLGMGAHVVVDTSYFELSSPQAPGPRDFVNLGAVVVNSLTKSLGVPGLRGGFASIPGHDLRSMVEHVRQPWNVSSLASCVYTHLLGELGSELREWLRGVVEELASCRESLAEGLGRIGISSYASVTNFLLMRHTEIDALELHTRLLEEGIAVRPAHTFAGLTREHTRVAVKGGEEVHELLEVLERVVSEMR